MKNKNLKYIIGVAVLVVVVIIIFATCGKKSGDDSDETSGTEGGLKVEESGKGDSISLEDFLEQGEETRDTDSDGTPDKKDDDDDNDGTPDAKDDDDDNDGTPDVKDPDHPTNSGSNDSNDNKEDDDKEDGVDDDEGEFGPLF